MSLTEIIMYEGDNNTLVWRHPKQDFNTTTQLIVHESQEAIFFRNGQALDLFPSGRHTLETQNIPLIKRILNLPTQGVTPFHCEVYYINKVFRLNVKWGTSSKAEVLDPKFNILLNVGASGGMGIAVSDSRKFLLKLVGTETELTLERLSGYFRELVAIRVKSYLTRIMSEVSFVVVNSHLNDISLAVQSQITEDLQEYGIQLANFYVSTIHIPDEDKQKVKDALSTASARSIEGYNWVDEQIADIGKKYASNTGSGENVVGMLAQAPVAFAFGQMLKDTVSPFMNTTFSGVSKAFGTTTQPTASIPTPVAEIKKCSKCGAAVPAGMAFCSKCGNKIQLKIPCSQCGHPLTEEDNFCPKCGTPKKSGKVE